MKKVERERKKMSVNKKWPTRAGRTKDRNMDRLAMKADAMGVYTVESLVKGVCFFLDREDIVISSGGGFFRMSQMDAMKICKEAVEIIKDYRGI